MSTHVTTGRRPRLDGATRGYLALVVAALLLGTGVLLFLPQLVRPGGIPAHLIGMGVFAVAGIYVRYAGRLGPVAIHPLTLAAVLGGNLLVFVVSDDLVRIVYAGWNVMVVMYLATSLSRRMVVVYGGLCALMAAGTAALVPGETTFVLIRVVGMAGLVALPIASFLMLRGELDEALRIAQELASRDSLTGLFNRRGMFDAFPVMALGSTREAESLAVLVCDLDHFKRINDTQGHAIGDDVLRQVGATLKSSVRDGDIVARLGGEELCVIAAVDDGDGAHQLAERLRRAVQRDCAQWSATMSVGVAMGRLERAPGFTARLEKLLAEADTCLYAAKGGGRNQVVGPIGILTPEPAMQR